MAMTWEAEIELAIASAGKPVADHLAGGHLDGGGAGVTGERGRPIAIPPPVLHGLIELD
jgi:hypothetical protein